MAPLKMFGSEIATILLDICLLVALVLANYNSGKVVFVTFKCSISFFCCSTTVKPF